MRNRPFVDVPDVITRAALFPEFDLPDPPPGHPTRRVLVEGVLVRLLAALPVALASTPSVEESRIEEIVDTVRRFIRTEAREKGVWFVPEAASPSDLTERLSALGMRPADVPGVELRGAAMVAVTPIPPGPPDVETRKAANFEEFLAAQMITADSFAMDETMRRAFEERAERLWPFQGAGDSTATFVALIDGEVVATASASFGKSAVFLTGGGTRPDRRGRGAYTALTRARWDAAVEHGTPALTVTAGAMSRPILERLGFSTVGWINCLVDELSA